MIADGASENVVVVSAFPIEEPRDLANSNPTVRTRVISPERRLVIAKALKRQAYVFYLQAQLRKPFLYCSFFFMKRRLRRLQASCDLAGVKLQSLNKSHVAGIEN